MWKLMACTLLLSPLAHAAEPCAFSAPRDAVLDLRGVRTVVVEVNQHDLDLKGTPSATGQLHARACASSQDRLAAMQVTQRREGDRLIVTATSTAEWNISLFGGSHYAYLDLDMALPEGMPVEVAVGSGDAHVSHVAQLVARVGSGDLDVTGVRGSFDARVGSGDIKAEDVGPTHVASVGSGDFTINRVRGNLRIDHIGSGDADVRAVGGDVDVAAIGSGDLRVNGVARNLHVASIGSGDIDHMAVAGRIDIPKQD